MNSLANEKSPYLRQHAENPVDWHPWNEKSLEEARKLGKPIFLSIGYSTCHWCHVMAHESFENKKMADLLNQSFFNIKVDREERPDVDAIYMTAVQALTGSGGWPMSVWMTPDLKPFFAGTYFPPEDRHGRTGFHQVLTQIAELWKSDRARVLESAEQVVLFLEQYNVHPTTSDATPLNLQEISETAYSALCKMFDPVNGGFGSAPKFSMPVNLEFLIRYFKDTKTPDALHMVRFTMEKLSCGGIYDHVGGGFARYSTDEKWIVPHFEKMLYDNAQLISVCAGLYELTKEVVWEKIIRQTIQYVERDLKHGHGGFFSAEDADSEGKEGIFYLWTFHEIQNLLTPDELKVLLDNFHITIDGNFLDPHTQETGKNVLVKKTIETSSGELEKILDKLFVARMKRQRPHRDEKIITEWNGLMISALSKAGTALNEPQYARLAQEATRFVQQNLVQANGQLFRIWCDGQSIVSGQQADYAFLIQGLLDLYELTQDRNLLNWALKLHLTHNQLFSDDELGGYFMNTPRPDLLIRMKDLQDNVIPSSNSVAIKNGFRLAQLTNNLEFQNHATKSLVALKSIFKSHPTSLLTSLQEGFRL